MLYTSMMLVLCQVLFSAPDTYIILSILSTPKANCLHDTVEETEKQQELFPQGQT